MNGVYGLIVAIWATLFVISWKRKQKMIQHIWSCQNNAFSKIDERKDEFKFFNVYNDRTKQTEITKIEKSPFRKMMLRIGSYIALLLVLAAMIIYQYIIFDTKGKRDEEGNIIEPPTSLDTIKGQVYSVVYSIVIILFGEIYKVFANLQTNDENHRYKQSYEDSLITRVFLFNGLNFYFPLMYIAFDPRNNTNYDELFMLLLS
jgi:hypothetical protein